MITANIILKDDEHVEIVNTDVHFNSDPNLCTERFVNRAWLLASETALEMSGTDNWRLEMHIVCDFTTPVHDAEDEKPEIVRCENGVGEWEISPFNDTFDTKEEAEQALQELVLGDAQ